MPANHGMFRKGDVVRRAATPAEAVKFRARGWLRDDVGSEAQVALPAVADSEGEWVDGDKQ